MYNPQTQNRPKSTQQKQEPNARIAKQPSGQRGPNNKNILNSDTTTQYEEGKTKLETGQRNEMLRENHQKGEK
jgi:hypothetical protein